MVIDFGVVWSVNYLVLVGDITNELSGPNSFVWKVIYCFGTDIADTYLSLYTFAVNLLSRLADITNIHSQVQRSTFSQISYREMYGWGNKNW